jgi:hypothetical protein
MAGYLPAFLIGVDFDQAAGVRELAPLAKPEIMKLSPLVGHAGTAPLCHLAVGMIESNVAIVAMVALLVVEGAKLRLVAPVAHGAAVFVAARCEARLLVLLVEIRAPAALLLTVVVIAIGAPKSGVLAPWYTCSAGRGRSQ